MRSLYWITLGGTTGGLIYYTTMFKILSKIRENNLLTKNLIIHIEELLRKYIGYSILFGCSIGYLTGNVYDIIERLKK
jgi:hypothetical protein